jgi:hypothetical protein
VFEEGLLRTIFGPKTQEVTGDRKKYRIRSFMVCTVQQILLEYSKLLFE